MENLPFDELYIITSWSSPAGMEHELIIKRTRAGLDIARQLGRKGGRKPKMTEGKTESAKKLLASSVLPRT
ncbi:hypothetical protein SAMN05216317_1053 [Nitrosomonas eutropha]|uniref:hypothetical protein n=1 Tax=Nitrosomonas eutropha TaxID=916 RepID=UPI0008941FC5|nr:hypothetical protein SAMN05216317_1053 [Nitrosomonas eutropha]